jgi:large repetitive protein
MFRLFRFTQLYRLTACGLIAGLVACGGGNADPAAKPPPVSTIKISVLPDKPQAGKPTTFVGVVQGGTGNYIYKWDFGDGKGAASGERVDYIFDAANTYSVELTVTAVGGGLSAGTHLNVTVTKLKAEVANMTPVNPVAGEKVVFSGIAKDGGGDYTYAWDFGDGHAADLAQADHVFAAAGEYSIRFTAYDKETKQSSIATETLSVQPELSAFTTQILSIHPISLVTDQLVSFSGVARNGSGNYRYQWNFGDGKSALGVNPRHTYAAPGTYKVTLTASDQTKFRQASATAKLTVATAPSVVALIPFMSPTQPMAKYEVNFGGAGSGFGTLTYTWDFGDGSQPVTGIAPSHIYLMPGSYAVKLTVQDELMHQSSIAKSILVLPPILAPAL